jgi:hypothetical protein
MSKVIEQLTLSNAIFKNINQFKKLQFEISDKDYAYLSQLFQNRYPNGTIILTGTDEHPGPAIVPNKPFHEYNGKYYADVTLNKWQTSDANLMKLQEKIDPTYGYGVTIAFEGYSFTQGNSHREGVCLKFVKMN